MKEIYYLPRESIEGGRIYGSHLWSLRSRSKIDFPKEDEGETEILEIVIKKGIAG